MTNQDSTFPRAGHAGDPDVDGTPVGGSPLRRTDEEAAARRGRAARLPARGARAGALR